MNSTAAAGCAEEALDDVALLDRFVRGRDPSTFAELARRHSGLVYGACLRVLGDRHDAEELAQECFFQLARKAGTIRSSLPGWLHQTATRLSLNALRARGRRRAHEAEATKVRGVEAAPADPSWREVEPLLDGAVDALPDDLREAIVLHFLQALPQSEIAARLGVHQSTVSRRLAEGLRRLGDRLRASGVAPAAVPLADLLTAYATPPEAPDLTGAAGRLALAGAAGSLGSAWFKLKAGAWLLGTSSLTIVVEIVAGGWWAILACVAWLAFLLRFRPRWFDELVSTDGKTLYHGPFAPFRRLDWTVMPDGWGLRMLLSFLVSGMFGLQAWGAYQSTPGGAPLVGVMTLYAGLSLSTGLRIAVRAIRLPRRSRRAVAAPAPDGPHVMQALGAALGATLMTACLALLLARVDEREEVAAAYLVSLGFCAAWAFVDAAAKLRRYRALRGRTGGDEAAPDLAGGASTVAAAVALAFAAWLSTASLYSAMIRRANPGYAASAQGLRMLEASSGLVPALAITILALAIVPLARARRELRPDVWRIAVGLALTLAAWDLASCLAYILGWT